MDKPAAFVGLQMGRLPIPEQEIEASRPVWREGQIQRGGHYLAGDHERFFAPGLGARWIAQDPQGEGSMRSVPNPPIPKRYLPFRMDTGRQLGLVELLHSFHEVPLAQRRVSEPKPRPSDRFRLVHAQCDS